MPEKIPCDHCGLGAPYEGEFREDGSQCRLCWLYDNSHDYREFWGGPPLSEGRGQVLKCPHLKDVARKQLCPSCRGHVELKVYSCALHGECTLQKAIPGTRCCASCDDRPLIAVANANGVGDALLGLCATAGLKMANPRRHVIYEVTQPWQQDWCKLFFGYDQLVIGQQKGHQIERRLMQFGPAEADDVNLKTSRWDHYAKMVGAPGCVVPPPRATAKDVLEQAAPYKGAVVMSPYSAWPARAWPQERWVALEKELIGQGRKCVILDGLTHQGEADQFQSPVLGYGPALVAAVLQGASLFIGNDSGMAHAAGMLRTPALVLSWFYNGHQTYGIYGNSHVIQAKTFHNSITVDMVVEGASRRLRGEAPVELLQVGAPKAGGCGCG